MFIQGESQNLGQTIPSDTLLIDLAQRRLALDPNHAVLTADNESRPYAIGGLPWFHLGLGTQYLCDSDCNKPAGVFARAGLCSLEPYVGPGKSHDTGYSALQLEFKIHFL